MHNEPKYGWVDITLSEYTIILCLLALALFAAVDAGFRNDLPLEQYFAIVER